MHGKGESFGRRGISELFEKPKKLTSALRKHAVVFTHVNDGVEHDEHFVGAGEVVAVVATSRKSSFVLFVQEIFGQVILREPCVK